MFSRRPRKKKKHKAVFQKEKILTDVGVGLRRGLVDLHHGDHRVGVVGEDAHDREGLFYYFVFFFFSFEKKRKKTSSFFVFLSSFLCPLSFNSLFSQTPPPPFPSSPHLVVQQHRAPGLQQAPVHEAHDRDVVLGPHGARHDRVRLVDDFFQRAHRHGRAAEVVDLRAVAVLVVRFHGSRSPSSSTSSSGLGLEGLVGGHELLLHQEPVLEPLELEQPEAALGRGDDGGEAPRRARGGVAAALLAADARWGGRGLPLLLLLLFFFGFASWVVFFFFFLQGEEVEVEV